MDMRFKDVDCIHLTIDRAQRWALVNKIMHNWIADNAVNFFTRLVTLIFS
jgi:hypothetical protein